MTKRERGQAVLVVLSVAQFTTTLEFTIVYIALPSIAADLRLAPELAQWIVSAYAVLFAGFLLVGGRLADRLGSKRLFMISIVAFGVASTVGGIAWNGPILLVVRGGQGLAAALLQPAVLGLIGTTFPAGRSRNRALATWGAVGASGLAIGALLGGVLTAVSWRLVFWVNVPLMLLCAVGAAIWFSGAAAAVSVKRIPVVAAALGTSAVLMVVLGLTLGSEQGWSSAPSIACLVVAVLALFGFIRKERTARCVLVEPVLRRTRSLRSGVAMTALYMASVGSTYYLLTLLLQSVRGYTPLQAGFAFIPLAVAVTAGSALAGRLVRRVQAINLLLVGFVLAGLGLLWLSIFLAESLYVVGLLPGLVVSGLGNGIIFTSMFIVGTRDVPPEYQSTAGGLLTTSQYVSSALAVAALTLTLGPSPGLTQFRSAFLLTTAVAGGGAVLSAVQRRALMTTSG